VTGGPGGAGAAGATGVAGATGGPGGMGGSLGGAGSSGSTSVPGCPTPKAGGTCNVLPACGCPAGQVCYAYSESVGLTCTADSKLGDGADCSSAQVCASGFGCFSDICSKYCEFDSDCAAIDSARACLPTYWYTGATIPGVSVCARVCDPANPQFPRRPLAACPAGFGCIPGASNPGASQCVPQAGTGISYSNCYTSADCSPGYYCTTSYFCLKYCFTTNDCPLGSTCTAFFTPSYAGTASVGYCY
jgi:hypothetical protein